MIVRTWHGCVPLEHAEGFAAHLQKTGVEHSQRTAGNRGAFVRQETQGDWAHFFLATYWEDLSAVKAFAGEDYQVAVTFPTMNSSGCSPIRGSFSTMLRLLLRCNPFGSPARTDKRSTAVNR